MSEKKERQIHLPLTEETARSLKAGEFCRLEGTLYVARDAAHQRMAAALAEGKPLPFDLQDQCIYYMGPSPAPPGHVIGSAGPTTAGRMDRYTPALLDLGLKAMVGKGRRTKEVLDAIKRNGAVYFGAVGGAGALLSRCITSAETVAWPELGAEALLKITVRDFPVIVLADSQGGCLYE